MKLSEAILKLKAAGIDNPRHDARELFSVIGGIPRSALLLGDAECNAPELSEAIERRCKREPLQYIIGEVEFYRESYTVSPDCLIPRQDTEILVDYAVKNIPDGSLFLDLCTGSGCVAISTLKNTRATSAVAVDISDGALNIARKNAERNGVADRIALRKADALREAVSGDFYAILANPPYVTEDDYELLAPEIYFEPRAAFVGGKSGIEFYEAFITLYKARLCAGGFFAFEIGYNQANELIALAEKL